MKLNKYLIALTPIGRYFFGGDATFAVASNKNFPKQLASYIVESNKMPQQTSLLGMLRFLLLCSAGDSIFKDNKIVNDDAAKELIGAKSFEVNEYGNENSFGLIKSIGFCRVEQQQEGDWYAVEQCPVDYGLNVQLGGKSYHNGKKKSIDKIENYSAKDGLKTTYLCNSKVLSEEDIFCEDRRVGISKNYKGLSNDKAYFKQVSYRLKETDENKMRFAFEAVVDIGPDEFIKSNGKIVSIGGDSSQFIIEIIHISELGDVKDTTPTVESETKLILLSDAYVPSVVIEENTCFAITNIKPFRFLQSTTSVTSYDIKEAGKKNVETVTRSDKYSLYAAGSVFYFDDKDKFQNVVNELQKKQEFKQIGYNQFKVEMIFK